MLFPPNWPLKSSIMYFFGGRTMELSFNFRGNSIRNCLRNHLWSTISEVITYKVLYEITSEIPFVGNSVRNDVQNDTPKLLYISILMFWSGKCVENRGNHDYSQSYPTSQQILECSRMFEKVSESWRHLAVSLGLGVLENSRKFENVLECSRMF